MPMYLCRWPNGDCSIVMARDRDDAICQLDETGEAQPQFLRRLKTCMVDFRLTDAGALEFEGFSDATLEEFEKAYPILSKVTSLTYGADAETPADAVTTAVSKERERVEFNVKDRVLPEDPGMIPIQEVTDMPAALLNRISRQLRRDGLI